MKIIEVRQTTAIPHFYAAARLQKEGGNWDGLTNQFIFAGISSMGEITLLLALDEFKSVFMASRNLAERTRKEHANDLKNFYAYLEKSGITRTGELSVVQIDRYLAALDERGYAGSTRKPKAISK